MTTTTNYLAYWRQKQRKQQQRNQQLAQQAHQDAKQIAQYLADNYGVQQVILFGSLVKNRFSAESDIDLAVLGLAATDFFQAYAEIMPLSDFSIDLKPLEQVEPHFYQRVLQQGEVLYETSNP